MGPTLQGGLFHYSDHPGPEDKAGEVEFILGLLLGAVVGVVAERILGYPFDSLILKPIASRRAQSKLRKMAGEYAISGELVVVGGVGIFVNQFFPGGIEAAHLYGHVRADGQPLQERMGESALVRPDLSPTLLDALYAKWVKNLDEDPHAWNRVSLALQRCEVGRVPTTEEPVLNLWFVEADYAEARVAEELWWERSVEERRAMDGELLRSVDPFF